MEESDDDGADDENSYIGDWLFDESSDSIHDLGQFDYHED